MISDIAAMLLLPRQELSSVDVPEVVNNFRCVVLGLSVNIAFAVGIDSVSPQQDGATAIIGGSTGIGRRSLCEHPSPKESQK